MKDEIQLDSHKKKYFRIFGKQIVNWNLYKNGGANLLQFSVSIDQFSYNSASHAYTSLFRRHEALRTTFEIKDGQPIQLVNDFDSQKYKLNIYKIKSRKSLKSLIRLIYHKSKKDVSNLEKGPLAQGSAIILNQNCHFTFMINHIISDDFSIQLLLEELLILYRAFEVGNISPLSPPQIQLKDYCESRYKNYDLEKTVEYWNRIFRRVPFKLCYDSFYKHYNINVKRPLTKSNLILKRANLSFNSYSKIANYPCGKKYSIVIDKSVFNLICEESNIRDSSPFTILVATFCMIFFKLYGHKRIFIVSRMDGRVNNITTNLVGNLTGATFILIYLNDYMIFDDVVRICTNVFHNSADNIIYNVKDLGKTPIFTGSNLCINYLSRQENLGLKNELLEKRHVNEISYFPLCTNVTSYQDVILIDWIYNPLIFRSRMVEFLAEKHSNLFGLIINNYKTAIGKIDLLQTMQ